MPTPPDTPQRPHRPDPAALAAMPFLAGLAPEAVADIAAAGRTRRLARDEVLFAQDTPATALHLILQGRLKVVRDTPEGERTTLRFLGPGEPAGVLALLGPERRYPATAVAATDLVLLSWEGAALRGVTARHPTLAAAALGAMAGRTEEAHARLHELGRDRVERRLALAVLRLLRQAGVRETDGATRIDIPLGRQDLAEMAGTTLATTSRVLSAWEAAGILAEGGRLKVVVRDHAALERIAAE
mgnify:CR=1 FL=1